MRLESKQSGWSWVGNRYVAGCDHKWLECRLCQVNNNNKQQTNNNNKQQQQQQDYRRQLMIIPAVFSTK
jgi:hypothetical protein